MAAGMGGVITSAAFARAVEGALPDGIGLVSLGSLKLRGLPEEESLYEAAGPR